MMGQMILRRAGIGLVTLWVVSVLVFAGTEILPGDVAEVMLGQEATPVALENLREKLGLNKPAPVRYLEWLQDMATADLGMSQAGGTSIDKLIGSRLYNTMLLSAIVAAIAVPISLTVSYTHLTLPTNREV